MCSRTYLLGFVNFLLSVVQLSSHAEGHRPPHHDMMALPRRSWHGSRAPSRTRPRRSSLSSPARSLPATSRPAKRCASSWRRVTLFRDSLAPTLLRILDVHPGGASVRRSRISRVTLDVHRYIPAPGLHVPVPAPSRLAATYSRAIAYERAKLGLTRKLVRNGIAPHPHPAWHFAGCLNLAGGIPHEPYALGGV